MRSVRAAAPWAALTALLLAPVAGVVALAETGREVPQQLDPRAVAVLTEPTVTTGDDPVDAVAHVQLGTAPSLASRGGSGIVTAIVAKPGDRLRSGDAVYAVGGVRKYAMASETPPYRDLVVGSQGADVLAAERFLKATGAFDHTPDDSFDRASAAAAHAVGVRSGARDPGWSFTPEMVVWLPGETFRVGSVELALGRSEPAAGETIVTGLAPVTAVRITDGQGEALSVTWPRVVSLAGKDLGSVGDPAAIPAKIASALAAAVPAPPSDRTGENGTDPTVDVVLRLPKPLTTTTVPAAAVMVDAAGARTCVWADGGSPYTPVPVTVTGGSLGTATVAGVLSGRKILGNPLAALANPQCPSS